MLRRVKQKYSDDCAVAACAMATDISYSVVLAAAKENGYVVNKDEGIPPDDLLSWLGFNCKVAEGFYCPDPEEPVLLCIRSPLSRDDYHAVILYRGSIYDPIGRLLGANLKYCVRNTVYTYWNITAFKD